MGRKKKKMRLYGTGPRATPADIVSNIYFMADGGAKVGEIWKAVTERRGPIGYSTVRKILRDRKNGTTYRQTLVPAKSTHPSTTATPEVVKKINRRVNPSVENPKSIRKISKDLGVPRSTVGRVVNKVLGLHSQKKTTVFRLEPRHKAIRQRTCAQLYENVLKDPANREFLVTLDETYFEGQDTACGRRQYYDRNKRSRHTFVKHDNLLKKPRIMVLSIISGRGLVKNVKIEAGAKINTKIYTKYIKKLFKEWILELYSPNEIPKLFFHHDAAPSHTSKKTQKCLARLSKQLGFSYINKNDIPVKGSDVSPADFWLFGKIKNALKIRSPGRQLKRRYGTQYKRNLAW